MLRCGTRPSLAKAEIVGRALQPCRCRALARLFLFRCYLLPAPTPAGTDAFAVREPARVFPARILRVPKDQSSTAVPQISFTPLLPLPLGLHPLPMLHALRLCGTFSLAPKPHTRFRRISSPPDSIGAPGWHHPSSAAKTLINSFLIAKAPNFA